MAVIWNVVPCSMVDIGRSVRGAFYHHHQGDESPSETSVNIPPHECRVLIGAWRDLFWRSVVLTSATVCCLCHHGLCRKIILIWCSLIRCVTQCELKKMPCSCRLMQSGFPITWWWWWYNNNKCQRRHHKSTCLEQTPLTSNTETGSSDFNLFSLLMHITV